MNSIFKLITNQQIPETANALVPVIGYEPWSLRALESIKSSIVNGVPTDMLPFDETVKKQIC